MASDRPGPAAAQAAEVLVLYASHEDHITFANAAYGRAVGFAPASLHGRRSPEMLHADTPKEAVADIRVTVTTRQPWSGIVRLRHQDGPGPWVRLNLMPLWSGNLYAGSLMIHTPITAEEQHAVEPLYRRMRESRQHGLALRQGEVVPAARWRRLPGAWRAWGLHAHIWSAMAIIDAVGFCGTFALRPDPWALASLGLLAALVAATSGVGLFLSRSIVKPLRQAVHFAHQIAACDLSRGLPATRTDEIGRMARALTQVAMNMRAMVSDVRDASGHMQRDTSAISVGSKTLSDHTESQASSLEQTAASMEEMTSSVRETTEALREAEVRSLAQRSAAAAKEVRELTQQSVREVEAGAAIAAIAGDTMTDIVGRISRVTELVTQISAGSDEQASGIAQINQAITHLDRMTQHNATLVEQAAQSAAGLATEADNLVATVSLFKLTVAEKQLVGQKKPQDDAVVPAMLLPAAS